MRYIIAGATAFALIAGIALGFVVSRGLDGSASAAPKAQAVEEQNLDGSGFIAVHEQGVADVNVLSMPPQTAPQGRLIELGTLAAPSNSDINFPLTDVADCASMRLMAVTAHASGLRIENFVNTSPDGSIRIRSGEVAQLDSAVLDGVSTTSASIGGNYPFVQVVVFNGGIARDVTAWIWCTP